jgi:small subunit ribosomal protein S21
MWKALNLLSVLSIMNVYHIQGVVVLAEIIVKEHEDLEKAIRRFRKKMDKEGIIRAYKKNQYFQKPSTIRHEQEKARRRKELKKLRKIAKRNMY